MKVIPSALLLLLAGMAAAPDRALAQERAVSAPGGRKTIRAARAVTPVTIDGNLDDAAWQAAEPSGDFIQSEPLTNEPASEKTLVRLAYDNDHLYISAYCYDSDPSGIVINEIRKDFDPEESDTFEVIIDTFADRRNGFVFITNVEGARADQQIANEGREVNASWDAVWFVKTRRVADGWIAELAIPFKSLRFDRGVTGNWGINFSRRIRRRNEVDFWSPIPREFSLTRVSLAGDLADLQPPGAGRNLRVKPYVLADAVRPLGDGTYDRDLQIGVDAKYGITPALTLDLTANPDFAQVEADEQEVNLTQFSQFFPEKRDFFLENSGIFYVGDAQRQRLNPAPTSDEDMLIFFSRRIGLTPAGEPIPILGGARVTGRVGGLGVGVLSMQTRRTSTTPANQYLVARVRKNLAAASDIGAFFMTRQSTDDSGDYNRLVGVDGNWRLFRRLDWSTYFVKSATPGFGDGQYTARTSLSWEDPFFHAKVGALAVGERFNSDLSYYRRTGAVKYLADVGIRLRPKKLREWSFREQHPHTNTTYFTDMSGKNIAWRAHMGYQWQHNNGANGEISYNPEYQFITTPFRLARNTPLLPAGEYRWNEHQERFTTDTSRAISGIFTFIHGGLWSGTQKGVNTTLTLRASYRFRLRATYQRRHISLTRPLAKFVTEVVTVRTNYSFTPNMFLDSLLQYNRNQDLFNANVRFNLIHRPLSDFFIVYNEQRFVEPGEPVTGRGVIVKFTRMMAF